MNTEKGRKAYIATSAPMNNTVESFWEMILENNVQLIMMLCPETENGKV